MQKKKKIIMLYSGFNNLLKICHLCAPGRKQKKNQSLKEQELTAFLNSHSLGMNKVIQFWTALQWQLDRRGVWGRMDTCICMVKSLCYPPETITALLISYTPIQNKKKKFFFKHFVLSDSHWWMNLSQGWWQAQNHLSARLDWPFWGFLISKQ